MVNPEPGVDSYYERHWSKFVQWWQGEQAYALHIGLYEKGVHNHLQSLLNMSDYAAPLLGLNENKPMRILDAGCGVGGSIIHLAQKYPSSSFFGVTITKSQILIARELAKKREVTKNTQFLLQNYRKTDFPDNYFDGVLVQESINYCQGKQDFLQESFRILKPGGRLVILDAFLRDKPLTPLSKKIYNIWQPAKGYPDLISVIDFNAMQRIEGFTNVVVQDLTRRIYRSIARATCFGSLFFIPSLFKRFIQGKSYKPDQDDYFFIGSVVLHDMLGLAKIIRFCSIRSIKQKNKLT